MRTLPLVRFASPKREDTSKFILKNDVLSNVIYSM